MVATPSKARQAAAWVKIIVFPKVFMSAKLYYIVGPIATRGSVRDINVEARFSVCLGRRGESRVFSGPGDTRLSPRLRVFRQYRYAQT